MFFCCGEPVLDTPSHFPLYRLNARALVLGSGCCSCSILGQLGPVTAEDVNNYILDSFIKDFIFYSLIKNKTKQVVINIVNFRSCISS